MEIKKEDMRMLFVAPEESGKGIGKHLLQYGVKYYLLTKLTVNEQSPQAVGFYQHMGFRTYKRTNFDAKGGFYPLLYINIPASPWQLLNHVLPHSNT